MKNLIIATALALFSTQASAATEVAPHEMCKTISYYAGVIIQLRQVNYSQSTLIEDIAKEEQPDNARLLIGIVRAAYRTPQLSNPEAQQAQVSEFKNQVYGACFDMLNH